MKELNLEVGQEVWSIQFGECIVEDVADEYYLIRSDTVSYFYRLDGKFSGIDAHQSLFLSNPFEAKPLFKNMGGIFEPKEKSDTISALLMVMKDCSDTELKKIARDKLQKLLESL